MKIGIVTVQDSNNFGSFLQAYALQSALQEMGHQVTFIRSRSKKYIRGIFYKTRPNKSDLLHILKFIYTNWTGWKKYKKFQSEQARNFKTIDHYDREMLDLVILGSDEIWNVQTPVFRSSVFYGVGMDKVMTYAVSIGNAEIENMSCIPAEWLHRISPILVRDLHTSEFLKTLQIESSVVCDPTFLVDKSIFERNYQSPLLKKGPFLLVYSYGLSPDMANKIRKFADQKGLKVFSACFYFDWCDGVFDGTALDFCSVLKQASYVFTSTYHGTIFSILNHKQFVSLPQSRKTSDLLYALNLSDRLISEKSAPDLLAEKLETKIEYQCVDDAIYKIRTTSIQLLKEGIETYGK